MLQIKTSKQNTGYILVRMETGDDWYTDCELAIIILNEQFLKIVQESKEIVKNLKKTFPSFSKLEVYPPDNCIFWIANSEIESIDGYTKDEFDIYEFTEGYTFIEPIQLEQLQECDEIRMESETFNLEDFFYKQFQFSAYVKNTDILLWHERIEIKDILSVPVLQE